jgi:hypothetical protein
VPRSVAGGSIDSLIHVGFLIGHHIVQKRVSSFRQLDRAVVGPGLRSAGDGPIPADRRNGGERKRCDQFNVSDQSHDQPIEPHRDRQLVELFNRAGQSGSVQ